MQKATKLILKTAMGFAATAGIFCVGLLSCAAYGVKNRTVKNPLEKEKPDKEKTE